MIVCGKWMLNKAGELDKLLEILHTKGFSMK